jgi:hypothetical protein
MPVRKSTYHTLKKKCELLEERCRILEEQNEKLMNKDIEIPKEITHNIVKEAIDEIMKNMETKNNTKKVIIRRKSQNRGGRNHNI